MKDSTSSGYDEMVYRGEIIQTWGVGKMKNCPFCGAKAEIEPWHGGTSTKHMVSCGNDYCPVKPQVTGETAKEAIEFWDVRTKLNKLVQKRKKEWNENLSKV